MDGAVRDIVYYENLRLGEELCRSMDVMLYLCILPEPASWELHPKATMTLALDLIARSSHLDTRKESRTSITMRNDTLDVDIRVRTWGP